MRDVNNVAKVQSVTLGRQPGPAPALQLTSAASSRHVALTTRPHAGGTQDHVELRLAYVVRHYILTWFVYDVGVALPWVEIMTAARNETPSGLFYLVRLARLLRMAKHFRKEASSGSFLPWYNIKYSTRSIVSFTLFIMVRALPTVGYLACLRTDAYRCSGLSCASKRTYAVRPSAPKPLSSGSLRQYRRLPLCGAQCARAASTDREV